MRPAGWLGEVFLLALLAAAPAIAAPAARVVASAAQAASSAAAPRPSAHWRQVEGRIESGYFQQDVAGLTAFTATLSADGSAAAGNPGDEEWRSYYAALLAYRLALLTRNDAKRAWPFTQQCVDRLNRALVLDTTSAEALALQSACLALQSHFDPWRAPFAAPLSVARIDKALKLAPDNPRVLLLGARAAGDRPAFFEGDSQQAFSLMQRAVSAFERQTERARGLPRWGAADAFTDLAQDYLKRGQAVAARNVLERALLVAPRFGQARRLMARIVSG